MHEDYYGFSEKPFNLTPDPKYLFKSHSHASAFERLQYAVRRREGFVVVTGDIGTGKTTLCRAMLDQLDRKTFPALVLNPFLSEEDLLRRILQDFGIVSRDGLTRGRLGRVSKQELIDTLNAFLLSLAQLGAGAMLIIDEAQNLPPQVLEQIRILSNLETDKDKLLQIVLVGQLNLREQLRSPELRQLDQRVSIRCELQPLDREETAAYIAHRLSLAGGGTAVSFAPKALERVHRYTGGIPRLINLVCDRALLGGYAARTARITPEIVDTAAADLELKSSRRSLIGWRRPVTALAAGVAAVAVVAVALFVGGMMQNSRASADALTEAAAVPGIEAAAEPPAREEAPADRDTTGTAGPAPVAAPVQASPSPAPGSARYSVVVASFRETGEAASLVEQLQHEGYPVRRRRIDTGERGVWHQVLAGPYAGVEEARAAEARIRQLPGYGDARLIPR